MNIAKDILQKNILNYMNNNKQLLSLFAILSFIIFVIVSITDFIPDFYRLVSLLPLTNCICYLILILTIGENKTNVATTLIIPLTFIRYSIIPIVLILSNYKTNFSVQNSTNGDLAIVLMIYENIIITVALIFGNKYRLKSNKRYIYSNNYKLGLITYCIILYCVVCAILFPDSMPFKTIFEIQNKDFAFRDELITYNHGSLEKILLTLFGLLFNTIRILFPVYVLHRVNKKNASNKTLIIVTVIFVSMQFIFITLTFAESIVATITILLTSCNLKKSIAKKLFKVVPIFAVSIIAFYFYNLYSTTYYNSNIISYISTMFNAYFTGIDNVAASQNISDIFNKWDVLKSSYQTIIPFNTTFFGPTEGLHIQSVYNRFNHTLGQIPPTIGNGYYFYGFLFAPMFSFLQAYFAVKFSIIANNTQINTLYYATFTFFAICLSLGFSMYNEIISLSWCFKWGIPLYLIARIIRK